MRTPTSRPKQNPDRRCYQQREEKYLQNQERLFSPRHFFPVLVLFSVEIDQKADPKHDPYHKEGWRHA